MDIKEELGVEGESITVHVAGEIDGTNVWEFEQALKEAMKKAPRMIIDLGDLEYVSSAGLRVFLMIRKLSEGEGRSVVLHNVTDDVMEIFTVTGFVKLLAIE